MRDREQNSSEHVDGASRAKFLAWGEREPHGEASPAGLDSLPRVPSEGAARLSGERMEPKTFRIPLSLQNTTFGNGKEDEKGE